MKALRLLTVKISKFSIGALCLCSVLTFAGSCLEAAVDSPDQAFKTAPKIGVVNFKTCVEKSKLGHQERSTFESMRKQMETILEEKEKSLNEMATKFNDPDYLDSLAPDAETELKRKFRAQSQELSQQQNQYYQALQQANLKIIQKISDTISSASAEVAKEKKLDLLLNEDGCFFYAPNLDVSDSVIAQMDIIFEKESKEMNDKKTSSIPQSK